MSIGTKDKQVKFHHGIMSVFPLPIQLCSLFSVNAKCLCWKIFGKSQLSALSSKVGWHAILQPLSGLISWWHILFSTRPHSVTVNNWVGHGDMHPWVPKIFWDWSQERHQLSLFVCKTDRYVPDVYIFTTMAWHAHKVLLFLRCQKHDCFVSKKQHLYTKDKLPEAMMQGSVWFVKHHSTNFVLVLQSLVGLAANLQKQSHSTNTRWILNTCSLCPESVQVSWVMPHNSGRCNIVFYLRHVSAKPADGDAHFM